MPTRHIRDINYIFKIALDRYFDSKQPKRIRDELLNSYSGWVAVSVEYNLT